MSDIPVSIIVSNHNYARYLRAAIDSALAQSRNGEEVEVIVVDDGSTDESRSVIESYGSSVRAISKPNGGQASTINLGFQHSRGEVVMLLDADDVLLPGAAARALRSLRGAPQHVKVHWPMRIIDHTGRDTGRVMPAAPLPEGCLRDEIAANGPWVCSGPPTTGNAWRRSLLERVLPIPEADYRLCADAYLLTVAAVLGPVGRVDEKLACYRMHEQNHYWHKPFDLTLERGQRIYEQQIRAASAGLRRLGVEHDTSRWLRHSWWHRLQRAVGQIAEHVPAGEPFLLVDDDQWGTPDALEGRRRIPYPLHEGGYGGPPADEAAALHELRHQFRAGVNFLVIGWPCFWYLEQYGRLAAALQRSARLLLESDEVTIYQILRQP